MGVTIARVEKRYKESIAVSYSDLDKIIEFLEDIDLDKIIEFLKDIDSDEYPINFMERGNCCLEFVASEFNRFCEETGIENIPIQIKWLYKEITKPPNLPNKKSTSIILLVD